MPMFQRVYSVNLDQLRSMIGSGDAELVESTVELLNDTLMWSDDTEDEAAADGDDLESTGEEEWEEDEEEEWSDEEEEDAWEEDEDDDEEPWGEDDDDDDDDDSDIAGAVERVIVDGDMAGLDTGVVLFGLVVQCENEMLSEDDDALYLEELSLQADSLTLPRRSIEVLRSLAEGRSPLLEPLEETDEEIISSFVTADEARELADALEKCPELKTAENAEMREIVAARLIPVLRTPLPEGNCLYFAGMQ